MISSVPKKAVHVKWAGKTIALGTFPIAEADEKCARAKALTRAWRSTMRPKPSREWVINELERLNVRVVTGRCPRDDEYEDTHGLPNSLAIGINDNNSSQFLGYNHPLANIVDPNFVGRRGSITASLLNAADVARVVNGHGGGPSSWPSGQGQSFNGFGFEPSSMMQQPRKPSLSGSSNMSSTANDFSTTKEQQGGTSTSSTATAGAPPHRPLVGGGSAAAYEAARAEHYRQLATNKDKGNDINPRELNNGPIPSSTSAIAPAQSILPHSMENVSNLGTSNSMIRSQGTIGGLSIVASQHYEMLKLHHMNLLNEIQETTLMMNIYQQQLQQHQQLEMQQQQQQQEQQIRLEENQKSYNNSIKNEMMPSHQQPTNNNGENHPTNVLTENVPQSKKDDGTEIAGCENHNLDKSMQIHTEKCALDKNGEAGTDHSSLGHHDPTLVKHEIVNNNDKISREDKLARIKAEIEERKRMLEELSKADDDERDEVHVKKSKISPV